MQLNWDSVRDLARIEKSIFVQVGLLNEIEAYGKKRKLSF